MEISARKIQPIAFLSSMWGFSEPPFWSFRVYSEVIPCLMPGYIYSEENPRFVGDKMLLIPGIT